MATDGSAQVDVAALTKKAEQVDRDTAAVIAAIGRGKRVRLCLTLAGLVLVVGVVWLFANLILQFGDQETLDELSELAEQRLKSNSDAYTGQVKTLVDNASPILKEAFQNQANKDKPIYTAALKEQRDLLQKNLEQRLRDKIQERHQKMLAQYKSILETEFPAAKDEEMRDRMVINFQTALDGLIEKYYIGKFRSAFESMYDTWDNFDIADPAEGSELALEDELYGNLIELLTIKLSVQHEMSDLDDVQIEGRPGKTDENK